MVGVKLSEKQIAIIRNSKTQIIGLHNHPTNLIPNASDFVAAEKLRSILNDIAIENDGNFIGKTVEFI